MELPFFEQHYHYRYQYLHILDIYKDKKIDISIKPTQVGLLIDECYCEKHLLEIVGKARENGHTVRLDMEDSTVTSSTINLCLRIKGRYRNIGIAIQANLRRTRWDIQQLLDHEISMRLVKGAYKENSDISYQREKDIEFAFQFYAGKLKTKRAYKPAIATHDENLLESISDKYFDYEFLYGIRRDIQKDLKDKGYRVRIYVPFGENWLPYTLRRLREWKNLKFIFYNMFREWFKKRR